MLIKLFNEVAYVWPRVGYPPLVTPFSQYVKNLAMMNVIAMEKGKERWGMIADDIWDMLLGKAGKLPGTLAPELVEKAEREGRKFFTGNPQDNYPDALDKYRKMMKENKWDLVKMMKNSSNMPCIRHNTKHIRVVRRKKTSWQTWKSGKRN